jgi:hypothetical protein
MRAACALLLVPLLALAAPVPKPKPKADFYPSAVGTKWVYAYDDGTNEHTREVTDATEKDGVTTFTITWKQGAQTQTWVMKKDADGVSRVSQNGSEFDPPHQILKAKLADGDEWASEYTLGKGTTKYSHKRTVGKAESVKVPAGDYDAFPVSSVEAGGNTTDTTLWYADGVGLVKIVAKDGTPIVLKEFVPAKK